MNSLSLITPWKEKFGEIYFCLKLETFKIFKDEKKWSSCKILYLNFKI